MATAIAFVALVALTAYVLLGGADFGGGVWDLLATGPRRSEQRALIAEAIGPIWEANHVWLILVVVLLFTCFPAVYSGLAITLHIPLTLMLIGIVLRGSAFAFRSYGSSEDAPQRRWGRVFAIASLLTPVLLGVCVGAIASGSVGAMLDRVAHGGAAGSFASLYVSPWLSPFTVAVGALALCLFAFLAATYLTVEADDAELREDFRRRALGAAIAVFVTAFLALLLARSHAPRVSAGLMESAWAPLLHVLTGIAAIVAIVALWIRKWRLARVAAAAQVALILWGWAAAQYPYLIPPTFTIGNSAAPSRTLGLFLIALALGAIVLFPSITYLFRLFKSARQHGPGPSQAK